MALIECQNLAFAYDGKTVLENINFTVEAGKILCVVGENGSGKSTLIKGLLGLKKPSAGTITTGEDFTLQDVGYLPQQTDIQKDFPASVREVVLSGTLNTCGFFPFYGKKQKERCRTAMCRFGLETMASRSYRDLSGGQQQRVLLARAACASHRLLVLDEPVTGLDPLASEEMYNYISELNRKERVALVMITHDIHGALPLADMVLHIGDNDSFFGTVEEYRCSAWGRMLGGLK